MPNTPSTPTAAVNNTAPTNTGADPRLVTAVSANGAAPQFKIPFSSQAIQSVESVDLDLVLTTTTGEKIILQQGALQAATSPDSKIFFSNGDSITAADQVKKLGVLKPVEGGSFRLKSGDASPAVAELVTGDGFGLGKELQDTMSQLTETSKQLEKVLQTLSTATLSNTADDSKAITAGPGTGTGVQKIMPQSENKFASPSPGSPPQPEVEKITSNNTSNNTDNGNVSSIKITSTLRGLYGAPDAIINHVRAVDKIQSEEQGKEVLKAFSQASLREMLPSDPLQVRISGTVPVALEPNGLAHNTLVMPGVLNASSIRFELPHDTVLPVGFQIAGQTFSGSRITIAAESLKDLSLAIQWKVADLDASITKADFQLGVKYLDDKGAELEQGRAPLTFTYGELKTIEDTVQLDANSNTKIFLSAYGYSYDILGDDSNNNIAAGNGNDTLDGGAGVDVMAGGAGHDTYVVDNTGDVVTEAANAGTDLVKASVSYTLSANVENLTLTGSDHLNGTGNELANNITGNSGNNRLDGGEGADSLSGGAGNDTYVIDNTGDVITEALNAGTDSVEASVNHALSDNVENLTLTGSGHLNGTGNTLNNTLTGNSGNNTLDGGAGADTMIGGAGNDTYMVDNTGDVVREESGAEFGTDLIKASVTYTLSANVENLELTGTDNLNGTGNELANNITGNSGNNRLDGGEGADSMFGDSGNDTYVVDSTGDVITEALNSGTDSVEASVNHALSDNVENLTLTGSGHLKGTGNTLNNTLTGNIGNNTLDGGAGADTMIGGDGNDIYVVDDAGDKVTEVANQGTDTVQSSITYTLGDHLENLELTGSAINGTGNTGDNTLKGNSGNNTLDGKAGADTMIGGDGNDIYVVDNAGDEVTEVASQGTDTVQSSITYTLGDHLENLSLTGTLAINGTGNDLANRINSNSANNRLDGGLGADTMAGGAGDDTYVVDNIGDVVTESNAAGAGTDTIEASVNYTLSPNVEKLILKEGSGNIIGTGNDLANTLTGNSGNNRLDGGAGIDTLIGGVGDDTYVVDSTNDVITEIVGEGTDTVESSASYTIKDNIENLILKEGSGNINGTGNGLDNSILGNSGNNVLVGGAGNDTLNGSGGTDTASYNNSANIIATLGLNGANGSATGDGTDVLINIENLQGGSGNDTLTGNEQANKLEGRVGNDTLNGGAGNDSLIGGAGADVLVGGDGNDTATYEGSTAVNVSLVPGATNTVGDAQGDTLSGIENLIGSSANDVLTGDANANRLDGGDGNDRLVGGGGVDTLVGGRGDDTFVISNTGVTIDDTAGNVMVESSINFTLQTGLDNLELTGSATEGTGNNTANTITGNGNNNILKGEGGDDTLIGGGGKDTLLGGDGNDILVVGSTDLNTGTFNGGNGSDTLKITASASATIDLTGINNANFVSIEKIDLTETTGATVLKLDFDAIKSLVDVGSAMPTLKISLGAGDTIEFAAATGQTTFNDAKTKTMTVYANAGSALTQLAVIDYA